MSLYNRQTLGQFFEPLYVLDVPQNGSGDNSQPPSLPPSPGLSYRTPRTPSLRHRSVTPSHHSSGGSRSRSQTLTEQMKSPPHLTEALDGSCAYWDQVVTMSDGTTRVRPVSPVIFDEIIHTGNENARIMAHRLALESPTVPRPLAIPHTEIASYPREWRDGACSGKYSYIPSYMGWH